MLAHQGFDLWPDLFFSCSGQAAAYAKTAAKFIIPYPVRGDFQIIYPLVNIQKAIENGHRIRGFTHETWWIFPSFFVCLPGRVNGGSWFSDLWIKTSEVFTLLFSKKWWLLWHFIPKKSCPKAEVLIMLHPYHPLPFLFKTLHSCFFRPSDLPSGKLT